jgi:glucokinase
MREHCAIGVDIGGTNIIVGVVLPSGHIAAQRRLETAAEKGFQSAVLRIEAAIRDAYSETGTAMSDICAIGVGCKGLIDTSRQIASSRSSLSAWGSFNIVEALKGLFDRPVILENNADAALLGESSKLPQADKRIIAMLTFGTGVGGGILLKGEIFRGCDGQHPELGHMPIMWQGQPCYCGICGCLESIASGTAISVAGQTIGLKSAGEVFERASCGHAAAETVVQHAQRATFQGVWTIMHTFLPDCIVLGGSIMEHHYHLYHAYISSQLASATTMPRKVPVLSKAQLGSSAGIVGAALLAMQQVGATNS